MSDALNIVARLYRWTMTRFARRRTVAPAKMESMLAAGMDRPRLVVLQVLGGHILEIAGLVLLPAVPLALLSYVLADGNPAASSVLALVGSVLGVFPLAMVLGVGLWGLRPERRSGTFYAQPGRLWPATVLTLVLTALGALVLWQVTRS